MWLYFKSVSLFARCRLRAHGKFDMSAGSAVGLWKGSDEGNTGYTGYAVPTTMALFEAVIKAAPSKPMLDDQNLLWIIIRSKEFADKTGIDVVALPEVQDFDYTGMVRTTAKVASEPP